VFVSKASSFQGDPTAKFDVRAKDLKTYLGLPAFNPDYMYPTLPVGVVMAMAYTSTGGSLLYIESSIADRKSMSAFVRTEN